MRGGWTIQRGMSGAWVERAARRADAVAALDVRSTDEELTALEAPYQPQENYWW